MNIHLHFVDVLRFLDKDVVLQTLGSSMEIKDHMGKPLAALEVFSKSLEYMKEKVLEKIQEKYEDLVPVIKAERIHWIVTVPAIWDEFAKQFMREAAEKVRMYFSAFFVTVKV